MILEHYQFQNLNPNLQHLLHLHLQLQLLLRPLLRLFSLHGEEAYSFTYTTGGELSFLEAVQEPITVIHDGTGYIFAFTGMTFSFDDPENVEIRERMLNSIRFLDGAGGSGASDEEVGDEEVEDEDDDDNKDELRSNLFE